jgi:hypothetical protein
MNSPALELHPVTGELAACFAAVPAELLDCLQCNIAVLAERYGPAGSWVQLGARLDFAPRALPSGLATVDPPYELQVERSAAAVGLRLTAAGTDPAGLPARAAETGAPLYVVADSFDMPWLPYAGHEHMPHSFLLQRQGNRALVTDAYANETAWGAAAPGQWDLDWAELPAPTAVYCLQGNQPAVKPENNGWPDQAIENYLDGYIHCPDRAQAWTALAVETWLLSRSRALHLRWLRSCGAATEAAVEQVATWSEIAGHSFLASRRVARGRGEPAELIERLAEALRRDRSAFTS